MTLELSCLNSSFSVISPPSLIISNQSSIVIHPTYHATTRALSSIVSSSWAQLTFSTEDVRSFLKIMSSDQSWDASTIIGLKPVTSAVIYASMALAIFIVLSVILCAVSCSDCCCTKRSDLQNKSCVFIIILTVMVLVIIGLMVYISYQVNRTKVQLDEMISQVNEEIYPKEIAEHLIDLSQQLKLLDNYTHANNVIFIDASHTIVLQAFEQILDRKYFFNETRQLAMNTRSQLDKLKDLVLGLSPPSELVTALWEKIDQDNRRLFDGLEKPLQELCTYTNGTDTNIDNLIIDGLDLIHQQLLKLINSIEDDLLTHLIPIEESVLIDRTLQDQIQWYLRMVSIFLLVFIIISGSIPVILFMCFLLYNRYCSRKLHRSSEYVDENGDAMNSNHSRWILCCTRVLVTPVILMMMIIILISIMLYSVDLLGQGLCRTVHNDQEFLVPFLIDEILGSNANDLIIDGTDINTTIITVIEDCTNERHFTDQFFKTQMNNLDSKMNQVVNKVDTKILNQFNVSINDIDIESSQSRLRNLSNITNSSSISIQITLIENDLTKIKQYFDKISFDPSPIPIDIINATVEKFKHFSNQILQSTIDACPLPLTTLYKADVHICHNFAKSTSGLWLSLFIYMFLITVGLWIVGVCYVKRSRASVPPIHSDFSNIYF